MNEENLPLPEKTDTSKIQRESVNESAVEFMLTEYQALNEARGRVLERGQTYVNLFLTITSGFAAFIAILSQIVTKKESFFLISSPFLLVLLLLGLVSYIRIIDRNISITRIDRGINRIRRFFVDIEPRIQRFLLYPPHDDTPKYASPGLGRIGLHTIIGVINSAVLTALFNIAIPALFIRPIVTWLNTLISIILFLISILLHELFVDKRYKSEELKATVNFPSK